MTNKFQDIYWLGHGNLVIETYFVKGIRGMGRGVFCPQSAEVINFIPLND